MRLGIYKGPVVAGIVGVKKFAYDIWSDRLNNCQQDGKFWSSWQGMIGLKGSLTLPLKAKERFKPKAKEKLRCTLLQRHK
jgi:hypothetical protein